MCIDAISERRGLIHSSVFTGSNNQITFAKFIKDLKAKTPHAALCVMDNLSVHKSRRVRELFDTRFVAFFLPPYSCSLNPIEKLWSVIKNLWRRAGQEGSGIQERLDRRSVDRRTLESLVRLRKILGKQTLRVSRLEEVPAGTVKSLARAHIPFLLRALRGNLV